MPVVVASPAVDPPIYPDGADVRCADRYIVDVFLNHDRFRGVSDLRRTKELRIGAIAPAEERARSPTNIAARRTDRSSPDA